MEQKERAAALFARGESQAAVARSCGVSRSTASRWHRRWVEGALAGRRRGRPPKLEADRLRAAECAFAGPPRDAGFDLEHWSLAAAAALIERRTGVRYHHRHVARLLERLGWIVPPFGRHAAALRRRAMLDPDGSVVALFERIPRRAGTVR